MIFQNDNYNVEILILDDTPANPRMLSKMLNEQKYKVRGSKDGGPSLFVGREKEFWNIGEWKGMEL